MTLTIYMLENVVETSIEKFSQVTTIQIWGKRVWKENVKKENAKNSSTLNRLWRG